MFQVGLGLEWLSSRTWLINCYEVLLSNPAFRFYQNRIFVHLASYLYNKNLFLLVFKSPLNQIMCLFILQTLVAYLFTSGVREKLWMLRRSSRKEGGRICRKIYLFFERLFMCLILFSAYLMVKSMAVYILMHMEENLFVSLCSQLEKEVACRELTLSRVCINICVNYFFHPILKCCVYINDLLVTCILHD